MLERSFRACEVAIGWITAVALAFCAVYVGVAVVGMFFRVNPPDEDLLVAEAVVLVAFLPQIVLVRRDMHVSVDLVVRALPRAWQTASDVLAAFCGTVSYALLAWAAWMALDRAILNGSMYVGDLELPEWPGRAMVLLGLGGGLLASLMRLGRLAFHRSVAS
jgi:TRAP-type C4-dicarboxylate transport system permease small subunit